MLKKESEIRQPGKKTVFKLNIGHNKEGFRIRKVDVHIWPQGDGSVTELESHFLINHV